MDTGAERAAERLSKRLGDTRREYFRALLALEDYVRGLDGDEVARQRAESFSEVMAGDPWLSGVCEERWL